MKTQIEDIMYITYYKSLVPSRTSDKIEMVL